MQLIFAQFWFSGTSYHLAWQGGPNYSDLGNNSGAESHGRGSPGDFNPNPGDSAKLVITTWIQAPPTGCAYSLLWAEGSLAGSAFSSITNVGQQATWTGSPIPGSNPFKITAQ